MSYAILGSGLSGCAVFEYLTKEHINCFFIDNEILANNNFDYDKILNNVECVVISPGISLDNNVVFEIKKRKIALIGELEFGCQKFNNDNIIAVTGTNGKTTTTSLINFLLRKYHGGVSCGGNIGIPVTSLIDKIKEEEIVVLECSSFQLETVKKFKPHISIILNISEDHLNRHKTIENYIECKYKITKNQNISDILILNADDENLINNPPKTNAQVFYFSITKQVVGCYLKNQKIYFYNGEKEEFLVSVKKIKLKGVCNLSNILASVLAVYLQTKNKEILRDVSLFNGLSHRLEFVRKIKDIEFYNDSKATNIDSVLKACMSFTNDIGLILGGSDKGYDFDLLFKNLPKNVVRIAIIGEVKNKIAFSAKRFQYENFTICDSLEEAVKILYKNSLKGDIVLLSPACASFDQFQNYEERGNCFKKIVKNLPDK